MGLLGALSETPPQQILIGNNVFEEYKGGFYGELCTAAIKVYSAYLCLLL